MEIFALLETLEDILEKSKSVPFTDKCLVEREVILDIIKEIRLKLPDELKQAKWIKEERERILAEAQKDANDIIKTNEVYQDEDGTYFRKMTTEKEELKYKEPKTNTYQLVVSFPSNYNTENYQDIIEAIEINVDGKQIIS